MKLETRSRGYKEFMLPRQETYLVTRKQMVRKGTGFKMTGTTRVTAEKKSEMRIQITGSRLK